MKNNKIIVIGLGQIGGSICASCKDKKRAYDILGYDINKKRLNEALKLNLIDQKISKLNKIPQDADFIIIATNPNAVMNVIKELPHTKSIIIDTASIKDDIIQKIQKLNKKIEFVGCHPIAGIEKSGLVAINKNLFQKKKIIITPYKNNQKTIKKVINFWKNLGAEIILMDSKTHDKIFAQISHLPHAIAYILVNSVIEMLPGKQISTYSGGGFKDFTRIAFSDSTMWHDIFLLNRKNIIDSLDKFRKVFNTFYKLVNARDSKKIFKFLNHTKKLVIR
jgi:prephenate dehydrogenase